MKDYLLLLKILYYFLRNKDITCEDTRLTLLSEQIVPAVQGSGSVFTAANRSINLMKAVSEPKWEAKLKSVLSVHPGFFMSRLHYAPLLLNISNTLVHKLCNTQARPLNVACAISLYTSQHQLYSRELSETKTIHYQRNIQQNISQTTSYTN